MATADTQVTVSNVECDAHYKKLADYDLILYYRCGLLRVREDFLSVESRYPELTQGLWCSCPRSSTKYSIDTISHYIFLFLQVTRVCISSLVRNTYHAR